MLPVCEQKLKQMDSKLLDQYDTSHIAKTSLQVFDSATAADQDFAVITPVTLKRKDLLHNNICKN